MDKNLNVRVMGFPKNSYDRKWLNTLSDRELSETALADGDTLIFEDLKEFQENLHCDNYGDIVNEHWFYFLTD